MTGWSACALLLLSTGPAPSDLPRSRFALEQWCRTDPQAVLGAAACLVAWLILAWLGLGIAAVLATRLSGVAGRVAEGAARRLLPGSVRRLLELALGLTLAAAGATPALAAGPGAIPSLGRPVLTSISLAPLPAVPAPVLAPAAPQRTAAPEVPSLGRPLPDVLVGPAPQDRGRPTGSTVVVHRGDSLWSIVARHLGPGASRHEIAAAWPRWFAANRHVLGADPDLLHPGQRLTPP